MGKEDELTAILFGYDKCEHCNKFKEDAIMTGTTIDLGETTHSMMCDDCYHKSLENE